MTGPDTSARPAPSQTMPLPAGLYLSCYPSLPPEPGGQVGAMFRRNRIFSGLPGVNAKVLTFDPVADHEARRRELTAHGLLGPAVDLLNIYDHYRGHPWPKFTPARRPLRELHALRRSEQARVDGTLWRVSYRLPRRGGRVFEYVRDDGSAYLRVPDVDLHSTSEAARRVALIAPDGSWQSIPLVAWYNRWVQELAETEPTFVLTDARQFAPLMQRPPGHDHYRVHMLHNAHTRPPGRWDAPLTPGNQRLLAAVDRFDALVVATRRQRADISRLRGGDKLYVVPNTVDAAQVLPEVSRDPHRVVMLARLVRQKGLRRAIAVFVRVVREVPEAHLDIYGEGKLRRRLERDIAHRGLQDSITLRGYDRDARAALWTCSALLLTSRFEAHPLAVSEAMARACPVVAFDIPYGPSEQLTDGKEGFVVPEGDVDTMANRLVALLRSPDLVARMGEAGRATAGSDQSDRLVSGWAEVIHGVMAARSAEEGVDDAS